MKANIKKWLGVPVLLISSASWAVPTLYPVDPTRLSSLINETNSNLVMDDTDSQRIYVMPPNSAVALSTGLHTITANVGFCREMADTQKYSRRLSDRINELDLEASTHTKEIAKIQQDLNSARIAATEFASSKNLMALVELDNRIANLEGRLTDLYDKAQTCKDDCNEINTEIRDVNSNKTQLLRDRRDLAKSSTADVRQYEKLNAKVEAIKLNLKDASQGFADLTSKLQQSKIQLYQMYATFAKLEGARAGFSYKSTWDENLRQLRSKNPGYSFEKIQTANAKLHSSLLGLSPALATGAIMAYETPGLVSNNGVLEMPAYPENFSANIVLSLLGTCPLRYPEYFDDKKMPSESDMKYGLTIAYDFPSNFKLTVTAKYNMYKMYQKIVSSGSSGGFFSSRSWTDVSEKTDFRDSFKVEWKEQDPSNSVSEEERVRIEQELKSDIFKRMAILSMPDSPDKGALIAAIAPPPHGAVVISNSLMNTCPGNIYCVGGAVVFSVLDAIFGNSQAVSSYIQTQNIEVVNTWSKDKVTLKPWITTYTPEQ